MAPFRVLQVSMLILMLFGSTWIVRLAGQQPLSTGLTGTWLEDQPALANVLEADNSGKNNRNGNSNNSNSNNNNGNANSNNSNSNNNDGNANNNNTNNNNRNSNNSNGNSNSNGNGNGNNNGNGNDNFDLPPLPSSSSSRSSQPDPGCAEPGQDKVFTSRDGKAAVRVFPNTPSRVRIEILPIIDFATAPLPPGNLVGLLAYEIRASHCDGVPLQQLPAEMNLAIRYTDLEAVGLDEKRFVIGRLNLADGTWSPLAKRANDTANNVSTATISETGYYMVWEER